MPLGKCQPQGLSLPKEGILQPAQGNSRGRGEDSAAPSRGNAALEDLEQTAKFNSDLYWEKQSQSARICCKTKPATRPTDYHNPQITTIHPILHCLFLTQPFAPLASVLLQGPTQFYLCCLFSLSCFPISFPTLFQQTNSQRTFP